MIGNPIFITALCVLLVIYAAGVILSARLVRAMAADLARRQEELLLTDIVEEPDALQHSEAA